MPMRATAFRIALITAAGLLACPCLLAADNSPLHLADWKSFFHGDPPAPVKAPPPAQLASVSSLPGVPADPQVEAFMRTLAEAVMARDGRLVLPRVSQKYTVDDLPDDSNAPDFLRQAIEKMPGPTHIVIRSVESRGGVRTARIEFRYGPEKSRLKTFRFDADGKLLGSDLFTLKRM